MKQDCLKTHKSKLQPKSHNLRTLNPGSFLAVALTQALLSLFKAETLQIKWQQQN